MLACAGAYLLYGSEALLPGANYWLDEDIEKFMGSILNEDESFLFFNSNIPSERYMVIQCDSAERQDRTVRAFYEKFAGTELPVTVIYKKSVRFRDASKSFNELYK